MHASDAASAVTNAWAAYRTDMKRRLKPDVAIPDRNGWTGGKQFVYETSPRERAVIVAVALHSADTWTVLLADGSESTFEKRGAQINLVIESLLPKGYARKSFAGRKALPLTPGRLGKPTPVDRNTLFMAASNTKGMTTLLLVRLVDAQNFGGTSKSFRCTPISNSATPNHAPDRSQTSGLRVHWTAQQDLKWLFQFKQRLTVPANKGEAAKLADHYSSTSLGDLKVDRHGSILSLSSTAGRAPLPRPETTMGTTSFITVDPSRSGFKFVNSEHNVNRAFVIRDGEHEYTFAEIK